MGFVFRCFVCRVRTDKCSRGTRRKVLCGQAVVCRPCQILLQERVGLQKQQRRQRHRARYQRQWGEARRLEFESRLLETAWHPDENRNIPPAASLTITTGGICFGLSSDIAFASSEPLRTVKDAFDHELHGVHSFRHCHNIAVRNGRWNVYPMHVKRKADDLERKAQTVAYLVCLEGYDPVVEARYILFHSIDSAFGGNAIHGYGDCYQKNCHRAGILKQGRYDWNNGEISFKNNKKCYGMKDELEWDGLVERHVLDPGLVSEDEASELSEIGFHQDFKTGNDSPTNHHHSNERFQFTEYGNNSNSIPVYLDGSDSAMCRIRVDGSSSAVRSFLIFNAPMREAYFAGLFPQGPPTQIHNPLGYDTLLQRWRDYDPAEDVPQIEDPQQRKITEFFQFRG